MSSYQVAARLTKSEHERIQELVKAGLYRCVADFTHEAVRDKLREMEPIGMRDVSL